MALVLPDDTRSDPKKMREASKLTRPAPAPAPRQVNTDPNMGTVGLPKDDMAAVKANIRARYGEPMQGARDFLNLSHRVQGWAQGKPTLDVNGRVVFPTFNPTTSDLENAGVLKPEQAPQATGTPPPTAMVVHPGQDTNASPPQTVDPSKVVGSPAYQKLAGDISKQTDTYLHRNLAPVQQTNADGTPVAVFSDGSAGIKRTLTQQDIADAAKQLNVAPASNLMRPLASDVYGGTQSSSDMADRILRARQGPMFDNTSPAWQRKLDQSDAVSIANQDWRSPLGTAAHNLGVEMDAGTVRQRRSAEKGLAQLARNQAASARQHAADTSASARQSASDESALQREMVRAEGNQSRALLSRQPKEVTLDDGSLGLIGPNGTVRRALGADGKPVRLRITKDSPGQKRAQTVLDNITKYANDAVKNAALSGKPMAIADARLQSAQLMGLPVAADKQGHRIVNVNGQWIPL